MNLVGSHKFQGEDMHTGSQAQIKHKQNIKLFRASSA